MILLGVPVLAGALLLVGTGLDHIWDPAELARAAGSGIRVARAFAVVELLIGVPSVMAVLLGTAALRWALIAQTVIYLAFAGHLWWRRRRGDRSDCGCNRLGTRVGPGGIARAWVLALLTLAVSVLQPGTVSPTGVGGFVLVLVSAAVLAMLLYALPAAVDGRAMT